MRDNPVTIDNTPISQYPTQLSQSHKQNNYQNPTCNQDAVSHKHFMRDNPVTIDNTPISQSPTQLSPIRKQNNYQRSTCNQVVVPINT